MSDDAGIERLAVVLAWERVWDHVMGSNWYGYPDSENDDEMQEAVDRRLPDARETAQRYADLLAGVGDGA